MKIILCLPDDKKSIKQKSQKRSKRKKKTSFCVCDIIEFTQPSSCRYFLSIYDMGFDPVVMRFNAAPTGISTGLTVAQHPTQH